MITRRSLLLLVPSAALTYGITNRFTYAEETNVRNSWEGEHEYKLPSGRLILDRYEKTYEIDAVIITDAPGNANIIAAALLTHLCPKEGLDENFTTSNGVKYKEHFPCQSDYSLVIFYAQG